MKARENRIPRRLARGIAAMLSCTLAACGGGSDSSGGVSKTLKWAPPTAYQDNTSLDPGRDLAGYNIYIEKGTSPSFSDNDVERAFASPSQTSLDLIPVCRVNGLGPGTYRVSIRAVAVNGLKSEFSPTAVFTW
jgi:hypothetical protein